MAQYIHSILLTTCLTLLQLSIICLPVLSGIDWFSSIEYTKWNSIELAVVKEKDVVAYEIERSEDGINFEYIGSIKALSQKKYTFSNPLTFPVKTQFFRIKIIYYETNKIPRNHHGCYTIVVWKEKVSGFKFRNWKHNVHPSPVRRNVIDINNS